MTTIIPRFPPNVRAELRNWGYRDGTGVARTIGWFGDIYRDKELMFRDGQPMFISVHNVREVRETTNAKILEMKTGVQFIMYYINESKGDQ